jgi:hypothetical protein
VSRGTPAELEALVDSGLDHDRRRGKLLIFTYGRGIASSTIRCCTGRAPLARRAMALPTTDGPSVVAFGERAQAATRRGEMDRPSPTAARRTNASAEVRYRDHPDGQGHTSPGGGHARGARPELKKELAPTSDDPASPTTNGGCGDQAPSAS